MLSYEMQATVDQRHQLVLPDVPFAPGQKVKILIVAEELEPEVLARRWDAFFKRLQALPHLQTITDADIQAEIDADRAER